MRAFFLLSVLLIIFVSCAQKPEREIIGIWKNSKEDSTIIFLQDGTLITKFKSGELTGTYKFIDENLLRIEFRPDPKSPASYDKPILKITISRNKLVLTDLNGKQISEFYKIK